jgi:XrtJ-associated TM-motif-TM protein
MGVGIRRDAARVYESPMRSLHILLYALSGLIAVLSWTSIASAFGGCVDSPENPSLILAALGAAGAALPFICIRRRKRNSRTNSSGTRE